MIRDAINKILDLAKPETREINGYTYTDKMLDLVYLPKQDKINLQTLKGLADILKFESGKHLCKPIVRACNHGTVVIETMPKPDRTRDLLYKSVAEVPHIIFDEYISIERMLIQLRSKFVRTKELEELVKMLGNIKEENNIQTSDDGFSQVTTVKKGISLVENKIINPIVKLKPYRTFLEVDQPESEFLVRLQEGGRVALFEADGGAWKLEARKNIVEFLRNEIGEEALIIE